MIGVANALPATHRKVAVGPARLRQAAPKFGDACEVRTADGRRCGEADGPPEDHSAAHLVGHSMGAIIVSQRDGAVSDPRVSSAALVDGRILGCRARHDHRGSAALDCRSRERQGPDRTSSLWLLPGMNEQTATATNAGMMKGNDLRSLTAVDAVAAETRNHGNQEGRQQGAADCAARQIRCFQLSTAIREACRRDRKMVEIAGANHCLRCSRAERSGSPSTGDRTRVLSLRVPGIGIRADRAFPRFRRSGDADLASSLPASRGRCRSFTMYMLRNGLKIATQHRPERLR